MVRSASVDKWQRYQQALLKAMGFDLFPTTDATTWYQLLIIPTFHPPSCLRLTFAVQEGELSFCLLAHHHGDLFQAIWREDVEAELLAERRAKAARLEDIAQLNASQVAGLEQQLARLEPLTLHDCDLTVRDGISLRCDCHHQNTHHTFSVRSPTVKELPRHAALSELFFETAHIYFDDAQIREYLASVASYLR
jgi:hypothetical protein